MWRLTARERDALAGFMARGGFLLLIQNNYAYPEALYRQPAADTLFDVLATELPESKS